MLDVLVYRLIDVATIKTWTRDKVKEEFHKRSSIISKVFLLNLSRLGGGWFVVIGTVM